MILALLAGLAFAQTTPGPDLSRKPAPLENPGNWISDNDYPPAASRRHEAGVVGFELTIGAQGDVTGCKVTTSASLVLDQTTCALLIGRARFRPALDAAGRPATAQWRSRVTWKTSPIQPIPLGNWHSLAVVKVDADGVAIACSQEKFGSVKERPGGQCDAFALGEPMPFLAKIDGMAGKPHVVVAENALVFQGQPGLAPDFRYMKSGYRVIGLVKTRFEVSETGVVENCSAMPTGKEGKLAQAANICREFDGNFIPVRGADGSPHRVIGTAWFAISVPE